MLCRKAQGTPQNKAQKFQKTYPGTDLATFGGQNEPIFLCVFFVLVLVVTVNETPAHTMPTAVVSIRKKLQLATSNVESSSWRNFRWSRTMPRPVSELRHIRSWIWLAWLAASGRGANEDHDGLSKFVLSEKLGIAMCRFAGYQSLSQRQT